MTNILQAMFLKERGLTRPRPTWTIEDLAITHLKSYRKFSQNDIDEPAYAAVFCPSEENRTFLVVALEDGRLAYRHLLTESDDAAPKVSTNQPEFCHPHDNVVYDIAWLPGTSCLVTASGDNASQVIDFGSKSLKCIGEYASHIGSVRRVDTCPGSGYQFATGGRDGNITVFDVRTHKPENKICYSHLTACAYRRADQNPWACSVLAVKYRDERFLVSCGTQDGSIKVWDLRKTFSVKKKQAIPYEKFPSPVNGKMFVDLAVSGSGTKLYAASTDNSVYNYTFGVANPQGVFRGAEFVGGCTRICLSPGEGNYLLSGSRDNNGYIWKTDLTYNPDGLPLVKLAAHTSDVNAVAWAEYFDTLIVTCGDENTQLIWSLPQDHTDMGIRGTAEDAFLGNSKAVFQTSSKPIITTHTFSPISPPAFLANLPNRLVDDMSPQHVLSLPRKENVDWLTKMRETNGSVEKAATAVSSSKKSSAVSSLKKSSAVSSSKKSSAVSSSKKSSAVSSSKKSSAVSSLKKSSKKKLSKATTGTPGKASKSLLQFFPKLNKQLEKTELPVLRVDSDLCSSEDEPM